MLSRNKISSISQLEFPNAPNMPPEERWHSDQLQKLCCKSFVYKARKVFGKDEVKDGEFTDVTARAIAA